MIQLLGMYLYFRFRISFLLYIDLCALQCYRFGVNCYMHCFDKLMVINNAVIGFESDVYWPSFDPLYV
jgi:hypothetical protein